MEHKHVAKAYTNILKLLPKASVNFQNPLHSPGREKRSDHHHMNKHKTHMGKGFSGSVMSMSLVPIEARRNSKNNDQSVANQEPTSPKISCMGQIKQKHKKKFDKAKSFSVAKEDNNITKPFSPKEPAKKRAPMLKRMFTMSKSAAAARKSFDQIDHERPPRPERAPGLSQMKRFASGRETFASFDWTAHQVAPETDRGIYYSYEERGDSSSIIDQERDEDEFIIPFSAPIAVVKGVALQPRKEVNLWKRRTANPPAPLQLNSVAG